MSNPHEPGQFGSPQDGPPHGAPPPFGGPPQQPPTEPYGWQPGYPVEPVPPAGNNKAVLIAIAVVVALGLGLGAFYLFTKKDAAPVAGPATSQAKSPTATAKTVTSPPKPSKKADRISRAGVGDCVKVNDDSEEDADVDPLDCAKPDAVFKIAIKLDSGAATCPEEGDYLEYEETGRLSAGFSLCLVLNAKVGECFTDLEKAAEAEKVACADPTAKFEVLEIVDGGTAPEDCTSSAVDDGFIYPEPKMVICGKSRN
jgi:hypothetical protein